MSSESSSTEDEEPAPLDSGAAAAGDPELEDEEEEPPSTAAAASRSRPSSRSSVASGAGAVGPPSTKSTVTNKRGKQSGIPSNPLDAVTAGALTAAVSQLSAAGFHGLAGLLANALVEPTPAVIPTTDAVRTAAKKSLQDAPVWPHWSKPDTAPQFKMDPATRLTATAALRGYRMARASHGCGDQPGNYYFEILVLPGPSASEILKALPSNARLGPGLREQLLAAVAWEQQEQRQRQQSDTTTSTAAAAAQDTTKKRKLASSSGNKQQQQPPPPPTMSHVRVGWSMRTGDLQAPVGYDKWSYGIRDTGGSLIHASQRQDHWCGSNNNINMGFGVNDVIGCCLCIGSSSKSSDSNNNNESSTAAAAIANNNNSTTTNNHIRFFKNGQPLGQFVLTKGKREGGQAFSNIPAGTYYPAISCYMGGTVRANFGPHWMCPPKKSQIVVQPVARGPPSDNNAAAAITKLFRKSEHQQALKEAMEAEAQLQRQAYEEFFQQHVEEIRQVREERGLSTADLPELKMDDHTDADDQNKDDAQRQEAQAMDTT